MVSQWIAGPAKTLFALIVIAILGLVSAQAQAYTDLVISEYVEGSGNNKALEFFNGTTQSINLNADAYVVQYFFNGQTAPGTTIALMGLIPPGGVFVLARGDAATAILAVANQTNLNNWYNGDDAVVLRRGGAAGAVVDSIGQVGFQPVDQWGEGLTSTQDNTLRRKPTMLTGDTNPFDVFDPAIEWDGFPLNTFADLGLYLTGVPDEPSIPVITGIHQIQGNGLSSPMVGQTVLVEAVVVGDFQDGGRGANGNLRGFFLQEEDANADDDPLTSEGIFVFERTPLLDVSVGDRVQVSGPVSEFRDLTQITAESITIMARSVTLPTPATVSLPVGSPDYLERYEGMRVVLPQALVISEYFNFDRFGEMVLALPLPGEDRPFTPTNVELPGSAAALAREDLNRRSRIVLDDGFTVQNPDPARHPNGAEFTLDNRFRGGDTLSHVGGILEQRFGTYRIQPTDGANHVIANPRPLLPPHTRGRLTVASFNVLNYFTTLDTGAAICGPSGNLGCRGADNAEEFERQRTKIISALVDMDADVVGLIELENNDNVALADLVAGLNDATAPGTYAYIPTGFVGNDAIKNGFIYKPGGVRPVGAHSLLDSTVDPAYLDTKNRPALAQTFAEAATGARVTVVVNHFKSKGSACNDVDDPDLGDGQGNCNATRTAAAEALARWLATDPTGNGDADVLIVGDINAYALEDPIRAFQAAGYTDLLRYFQGAGAYTFVFDGQFGYLDHALASASLLEQVSGAAAWSINADEPDILDFDLTFKRPAQQALYEPNAFRSSDHDPVLVGLDLYAPPVCDTAYPNEYVLWPPNHRMVPVRIEGVATVTGEPVSLNIDAVFQDEPVTGPGDKFAPDALGIGSDTVNLRAERAGGRGANGRVYHLYFTANSRGGSCTGVVQVGVPLNQGVNGQARDDGPLFDSSVWH